MLDDKPVKVGKDAKENWDLLDQAHPEHWIFHLADYPSCYVIWENESKEITKNFAQCAGVICANNTKYRHLSGLKVEYCKVKNAEKGNVMGEFSYKGSIKTVRVS